MSLLLEEKEEEEEEEEGGAGASAAVVVAATAVAAAKVAQIVRQLQRRAFAPPWSNDDYLVFGSEVSYLGDPCSCVLLCALFVLGLWSIDTVGACYTWD